MTRKIISTFLIITFILGLYANVSATELNTILKVLDKSSETKYLENEQGYFVKEIVNSDSDKGEITVELKVVNTKTDTTMVESGNTEVIFVIDNSVSMEELVNETQTRRDVVVNSAKEFTSQLFDDIENLKVGLVYYYAFDATEDTADTENPYPAQESGTIDTAKILTNLTDDESAVNNALDTFATMKYDYGTNTDAGLQRAKSMFSSDENTKKFIILLSDGVPNHAVDVSVFFDEVEYTDAMRQQDINEATTATINGIIESNISLITILTGLTDLSESDSAILETVFGTTDNPKAGLLYNVDDADLSIIHEKIYVEVLDLLKYKISKIKVIDYFSDEVIENFDFEYIGKPSIGTVSETINPETNTIEWDIDILKGNEVATLKYKLIAKNMKNEELINEEIKISEKTELTYKDATLLDYNCTLSDSPIVQIQEENPTEGDKVEDTTNKNETTTKVEYKEETTQDNENTVTATITTEKEIKDTKETDGWILSEDKKTITKKYYANAEEIIVIEYEDGTTEEINVVVDTINNTNDEKENTKNEEEPKADEKTKYEGILPDAGMGGTILSLGAIVIVAFVSYKKYRKYNY